MAIALSAASCEGAEAGWREDWAITGKPNMPNRNGNTPVRNFIQPSRVSRCSPFNILQTLNLHTERAPDSSTSSFCHLAPSE